MNNGYNRVPWLKFMYWYTIIGAGGFGAMVLFGPQLVRGSLGFPEQDPVVFGVFGSVYLGFGIVSFLGLRSPLKFAPVLVLQLFYKSLWLIAVALPIVFSKSIPRHGITLLGIFTTYIIGDLIAIPFPSLLAKQQD